MISDNYSYKNGFADGVPVMTGHRRCRVCGDARMATDCGFDSYGMPSRGSFRINGKRLLNSIFRKKTTL